jgi:hypothetical protein
MNCQSCNETVDQRINGICIHCLNRERDDALRELAALWRKLERKQIVIESLRWESKHNFEAAGTLRDERKLLIDALMKILKKQSEDSMFRFPDNCEEIESARALIRKLEEGK